MHPETFLAIIHKLEGKYWTDSAPMEQSNLMAYLTLTVPPEEPSAAFRTPRWRLMAHEP